MRLSDNARTVLERRYLRTEDGRPVETPEEMLRRVAANIAAVEGAAFGKTPAAVGAIEEDFFRLMDELRFLPNSPTLMNAGRDLQQLAACFVLPIEDSMESIFETLKTAALIHKSGGGTGFSFSRLRPKNDTVGSTGGVASGPVSFLKVYNASTEAVKQGGTRRGANMGILRVDHPDILEFIEAKREKGDLANFNLSVAVTDAFMDAVAKGEDYLLVNPRNGRPESRLNAREVFARIVESAWAGGEPGVVFIDRMNAANPTPHLGAIESTNPCGEQPLLPYEACNLGSINLSLMTRDSRVDWDELRRVVHLSVRFLDDVIEATRYPVPRIEEMAKGNRKIGLGVMGWAEMLIQLGVAYDSEEAVALAREVMCFINRESKEASAALAVERGPFPNFAGSVYDQPGGVPLRNATTTTIAPTGTLSIIAETTGGIEPLFSVAFTRQILNGDRLIEVSPLFARMAEERGFCGPELSARIAARGSVRDLPEVPADLRRLFVTAHEIGPEWHIRMQAAFQEHTDNAVSKTVNFPREATPDDVAEVYFLAHRLGCKGVTVYRDGSIAGQPMRKGLDKPAAAQSEPPPRPGTARHVGEWGRIQPVHRPVRLTGLTDAKATPEGNLYLTLNHENGHPFELFAQIGKAGSDISAFTEAIARLISLCFRCGIDPAAVAEQLAGIGGSRSVGFGPQRVRSVPDAIGQFLQEYLRHPIAPLETDALQGKLNLEDAAAGPEAAEEGNERNAKVRFNLCPACGMYALGYFEGCAKCLACGHSEC
ncbi:MAG: vitamin B12-dependent ribonucleotide reductase [Bacteroidota bacterium]